MTSQGICKAGLTANVKRTDGTVNPKNGGVAWAVMAAGDIVYGDDLGTTDIGGFVHFYRADKSLFPLPTGTSAAGKPIAYKVSKTNLTVVPNVPEPGTPPPPPPTGKKVVSAIIVFDDGTSEDLVPAP